MQSLFKVLSGNFIYSYKFFTIFPFRHRLGRMIEICDQNKGVIQQYRQHLMRCVASEFDRREIIDNLQDGHALIIADYAMKILPTDAMWVNSKVKRFNYLFFSVKNKVSGAQRRD